MNPVALQICESRNRPAPVALTKSHASGGRSSPNSWLERTPTRPKFRSSQSPARLMSRRASRRRALAFNCGLFAASATSNGSRLARSRAIFLNPPDQDGEWESGHPSQIGKDKQQGIVCHYPTNDESKIYRDKDCAGLPPWQALKEIGPLLVIDGPILSGGGPHQTHPPRPTQPSSGIRSLRLRRAHSAAIQTAAP